MESNRQPGATETRERHLIAVLRGIRSVNRLIASENDPGRLVERACESLTATMGYHNAWIALLGGEAGRALGLVDRGAVAATAAAGFDGGFGAMRERLERGDFPACMGRALETGETMVTGDPATDCPGCPLSRDYSGRAGLTRRIEFDGVTYGILTASVPADYARDSEEQELFDELAHDLDFGLHKIATARQLAGSESLNVSLGHMLDEAPAAITIHDTDGNFLFSNRQNMRLHGYDSEEEFSAVNLHELDVSESEEKLAERLRLIEEKGSALFEVAHHRKDGSIFPLEVSAKQIEWAKRPAVLSIATDITERKRAEEDIRAANQQLRASEQQLQAYNQQLDASNQQLKATEQQLRAYNQQLTASEAALRLSEEKYRTLVEGSLQGVVIAQAGPVRLTFANTAMESLSGYAVDELTGMGPAELAELIHPDDRERFFGNFKRRVAGEDVPPTAEYRLLRKDGATTWAMCHSSAIDYLGEPATLTVFVDITDRKRAEEALRRSEKQLRTILDATPFPIALVDSQDNNIEYWSRSAITLFGHTAPTAAEWYQKAYPDPDYLREVLARWKPSVEEAKRSAQAINAGEYRIACRDGSARICELYVAFVVDKLIITFNDITERKQQEEALRRIEWMLTPGHPVAGDGAAPSYGDLTALNTERTILDAVGVQVLEEIVHDYLDLLDTSAAVYERNGDYALGIFASGWCRYLDEASRRLCDTDDDAEALACGRWHCHESCWTEASSAAIERGETTDIQCAGGLRIHAVPIRAGDRIVGAINFGYGDPPRDPQVLRDLATKYDVSVDALARYSESYESRPPYIVEMAKRRIESSARLIGEIIERKQAREHTLAANQQLRAAEQQLRWEHERLRVVMQTAPVAILMADEHERFSQANRAAEALFGAVGDITDTPLRCGDVIACVHRHESPEGCGHGESCAGCEVYRAVRDGLAGVGVDDLETEIHIENNAADTRRQILLSAAPLRFGDRPGVILAASDITQMRALHAKIAQSDRLSSMGMLAAGVAHEINNPLTYILYNLESLTEDLPDLIRTIRELQAEVESPDTGDAPSPRTQLAQLANPAMLEDILARFEDALAGAHRIRDIARGLGTFSRVERDKLVPVNLMHVIELALSMSYNEIKYRARLVKDYGRIPTVLASEGRLSQVFLNLLINATHAIDEGEVDNNAIRVKTWAEGDTVCAEIRDTGSGIAPETLDKLFEPFFTTKDLGKGSGLGLAISKNIVESYGGSISVESELGEGTAFVVRLPVRAEATDTADGEAARADEQKSIRGRILIIDDEAGIRASVARMLREHETVQAASGAEAKEILEDDQGFDLILCDMMMPKLSGMDLHRWLLDANPGLARQLIFITGGAFTPRARDYLSKVDNIGLEKPFDMAGLKKIVNDRLMIAKGNESRPTK